MVLIIIALAVVAAALLVYKANKAPQKTAARKPAIVYSNTV
jgi:hypothetical protein